MSVRNWEVGAWYTHPDYQPYRAQVTHVAGTTAQVCLHWDEPYYPYGARSALTHWHDLDMKYATREASN